MNQTILAEIFIFGPFLVMAAIVGIFVHVYEGKQ